MNSEEAVVRSEGGRGAISRLFFELRRFHQNSAYLGFAACRQGAGSVLMQNMKYRAPQIF